MGSRMSDLQDLIHKTSIDCIDKGKRLERERITKLLENKMFENKGLWSKDFTNGAIWAVKELVELIKGQTNE
jgi:hypothetical protein